MKPIEIISAGLGGLVAAVLSAISLGNFAGRKEQLTKPAICTQPDAERDYHANRDFYDNPFAKCSSARKINPVRVTNPDGESAYSKWQFWKSHFEYLASQGQLAAGKYTLEFFNEHNKCYRAMPVIISKKGERFFMKAGKLDLGEIYSAKSER